MAKYTLKRVLTLLPVFFCIMLAVFFLARHMAGTAFDLAGETMSSREQAALEAYFMSEEPIAVQYIHWLVRAVRLDLGNSMLSGTSVRSLILQRLTASVYLTGFGVVLSALLALVLGSLSAWKPSGVWDTLSGTFMMVGGAVPGFLLSLLLIYVFSLRLAWLPALGSPTVRGMVLPLLVIVLSNTGGLLKQVRSAALETLQEPFILTAKAKGLSAKKIFSRHVLRNGSLAIVTAIFSHLPHIIGGSLVVERVFAWPGMGSLMFSAVLQRDYPVIMGAAMVIALAVLFTGVLLDILYGLFDPRIGYESR